MFIFLAHTASVQATQVMGSDITYKNVGGQKYTIIVKFTEIVEALVLVLQVLLFRQTTVVLQGLTYR